MTALGREFRDRPQRLDPRASDAGGPVGGPLEVPAIDGPPRKPSPGSGRQDVREFIHPVAVQPDPGGGAVPLVGRGEVRTPLGGVVGDDDRRHGRNVARQVEGHRLDVASDDRQSSIHERVA